MAGADGVAATADRMAEKMAAAHRTAAMAINRVEVAGAEAGECAAWPNW